LAHAEELVQLVEKGYEAWNAGDRGWLLDRMSKEDDQCTRVHEHYGRDAAPSAVRGDRETEAEAAAEY
jgi:hypothetical protein